MLHARWLRPVAGAALFAGTLGAAEYAVLQSGFRLRVDRHETAGENGERVRLHTRDGSMELPASAIARFERDDYVTAPSPPEETQAQDAETVDQIVEQLAAVMELHPALVHSVIAAESAYDPDAVSPKGAVGLMQLMPETARELAVADARDPKQNVRGGTAYLKQLLERYAGSRDPLVRALAAYNAGPAKVDLYNGLPPYSETRIFVRRVIDRFLALTEPGSQD